MASTFPVGYHMQIGTTWHLIGRRYATFKFNFPPASVTPSVTNGNGQFVWIFCFSPVQNKSYPSLNNTYVLCVLLSSVVYFINFKDRRSTWNYKKEKKVVKSHKVLDRSRCRKQLRLLLPRKDLTMFQLIDKYSIHGSRSVTVVTRW